MYLVTGATGFIGRHLVATLAERGCPVRCLVRRSSRTDGLSGAELAYGDLATGAGVKEALAGVSTVIHLAGVTKALRAEDYYIGNGRATANLVRAMEGHEARLVHISSLAAAGPSPDGSLVDEDRTPSPCSHYGRSKLEAENIARGRAGTVILRPPVVYGPRDTDVFRILQAVSRGLVLEIAGGERRFSAIYVKDLACGILTAAGHAQAGGRTYFLTYPEPHTWAELTTAAARIMGKTCRTLRVPYALARAVGFAAEMGSMATRKPGILSRDKVAEARCLYWTCSAGRASRELNFTAATPLPEGLAESLAWYKEAGWLRF
jgi:nucleoside-diphosphate-sugar epimerase